MTTAGTTAADIITGVLSELWSNGIDITSLVV